MNKRKIHLIRSPGYGLTLAAETKTGSIISAESCSIPRANEGDPTTITIPEELAKEAVFKLLDQIYQAGVVDSFGQSLVFHYMALNQADVSKVITGPLNSYSLVFDFNDQEDISLFYFSECNIFDI